VKIQPDSAILKAAVGSTLQQPNPEQIMVPNEKENRATKRRIVKAVRIIDARSHKQLQYNSPPPPQDVSPLSISSFSSSKDRLDDAEFKITLEERKQPGFSSYESGTMKTQVVSSAYTSSESSFETVLQSIEFPTSLSSGPQALSTLARSKRQRGGSDLSMTAADGSSSDVAGDTKASSVNRRKRRRLNHNHALVAQEFDAILSQINKEYM
jgi:hypothetical protein